MSNGPSKNFALVGDLSDLHGSGQRKLGEPGAGGSARTFATYPCGTWAKHEVTGRGGSYVFCSLNCTVALQASYRNVFRFCYR